MNADGTNLVRLTSSDGPDSDPAWSPDGAKIAFMSSQSGSYDIYVMNANGLGLTALTSGGDDDWSPAWSPDGAKIAFSRGCYYYCDYDLFVMNVDGSGVTRFPLPSCDEADPAWSPDGQRIAFTSRRSYYGSGCPTSVMVMHPDGTNVTLVTNGNASAPAWRP
jgi:TolB protein